MSDKKKEYGQFFTTNYKKILSGMYIPENIDTLIEPFAGNCDLLEFAKDYNWELYDIEPTNEKIVQRDTLFNPPTYKGKFVITNPPYLARNKSKNKDIFDIYNVNDLYKAFLKELIINNAIGGIVIVPLNFWSSIRKSDTCLRRDFLKVYRVLRINVFEERVFEDTSYTVCAFQFEKNKESNNNEIPIKFYPSKEKIVIKMDKSNNYTFGGEIYSLENDGNYDVSRATSSLSANTNILVKCIDDNEKNMLGLSIVSDDNIYIDNTPNLSARTYATLVITPKISIKKQEILVNEFNKFIMNHRKTYHSIFLTNYRESKNIARKRISFDLVYNIVKHILYRRTNIATPCDRNNLLI
jgi:hypothetical protein